MKRRYIKCTYLYVYLYVQNATSGQAETFSGHTETGLVTYRKTAQQVNFELLDWHK